MDKFQFISDLLENQKMNTIQKERFLKLSSKEIGLVKPSNEVLWEEIEKIKKELENKNDSNNEEITIKKNNKVKENKSVVFPKTHNARSLVKLMNQFSDNTKALKYTTHSWEHGRFNSYEDFMSKIKIEWNLFKQDLKNLNPRLHAKISSFLFNKYLGTKNTSGYYNTWGDKKLKFGWSSKAIENHMQNAENDPFSCVVPEDIKNLDFKYNLLLFDHYVSEFKNEIEIREDNSALVNMINSLWTNELTYDFNIDQQNTEGVSFFTDVPYLKTVLKLIFKSFKNRTEFSNIVCRINENFEKSYIELSLIQLGSKCKRDIDHPKIITPTGGDLSTIIENLMNLADFSVIGEFKDGNIYKVNYLTSNDDVKNTVKLDGKYICDGFTYVLKFYL